MEWGYLISPSHASIAFETMKRTSQLIALTAFLSCVSGAGDAYAVQRSDEPLIGSGVIQAASSNQNVAEPGQVAPVAYESDVALPPIVSGTSKSTSPGAIADDQVRTRIASRPWAAKPPIVRAERALTLPPIVRSASPKTIRPEPEPAAAIVAKPETGSDQPLMPWPTMVTVPVVKPEFNRPALVESRNLPVAFYQESDEPQSLLAPADGMFGNDSILEEASNIPLPSSLPSVPRLQDEVAVPDAMLSESTASSPTIDSSSRNAGAPAYFNGGNGYADTPVIADSGCTDCGTNFNSNVCATCGTDLMDGSCSKCGPGAAYSNGPVIEDYGTFGSVSSARAYLYVEGLYMTRTDGDIVNSNFGSLGRFDGAPGLRVTAGRRADSIFGKELGVSVLPGIEQDISRTDGPGRLNVLRLPSGGFSGAESSSFFNANFQSQSKETDLYSIEYNRVNWGWDLVKSFIGLRYIRMDDSYSIRSTQNPRGFTPANPATGAGAILARSGGSGLFSMDATNNLFGPQIGGELFYDIGYRWSASAFGKFGVFVNANEFDTRLVNNGLVAIDSENTDATIATTAELGFIAHYQLRTNLRFRAAYNMQFIGNVATVSDNLTGQISPLTGFNTTDSDDAFFHGLSIGFEFYR